LGMCDRRTTKEGSVIARVREVSWGGGCGYEEVWAFPGLAMRVFVDSWPEM
jgi:hypothetical protein